MSKDAIFTGLDKQIFQRENLIFSDPSVLTYVFDSQNNRSFAYPQHIFWLRNKKINFLLQTLNLSPVYSLYILSSVYYNPERSTIYNIPW